MYIKTVLGFPIIVFKNYVRKITCASQPQRVNSRTKTTRIVMSIIFY